jgi:hypothetical protein
MKEKIECDWPLCHQPTLPCRQPKRAETAVPAFQGQMKKKADNYRVTSLSADRIPLLGYEISHQGKCGIIFEGSKHC